MRCLSSSLVIWCELKKINTLGVARLKIACKWKREMVSFVLGKEREKDVFRLVTSVRQRKNGNYAILLY